MIRAIAYLVPLRRGAAFAFPLEQVANTRSIGYLLHRRPQALRLAILTPDGLAHEQWHDEVHPVLRRLAVAASEPEVDEGRGLGRRWLGVLVVWGGLLLLQADANVLQVLGGLWLAAGFPWLRQVYRHGKRSWAYRPAIGMGAAVHMYTVEWLEHPGLSRLRSIVDDEGVAEADAYRNAAGVCTSVGVGDLAAVYRALANGQQPVGVWAPMAVAAPPLADTDRQLTETTDASASTSGSETAGEVDAAQEGVELRTSSPAM